MDTVMRQLHPPVTLKTYFPNIHFIIIALAPSSGLSNGYFQDASHSNVCMHSLFCYPNIRSPLQLINITY
jgi:hypothetical protein